MSPRSRPASVPTLGPVQDPESLVPHEWWRGLFNAWYLRTDGDVVENETNTRNEVELLLKATGLRPDDPVLDLCCGQGRHSLELVRRGFQNVHGIDQSNYLIRLARRRQGVSTQPRFQCRDVRQLDRVRFPKPMACVAVLGNSFGYFSDESDDRNLMQAIRGKLRPGGCVALDLSDGAWLRRHFEPRSWEWIDKNFFVCRERWLARDGRRLICREVVTDARRGVVVDQFYAERLYDRHQIRALLEMAGFHRIRHHGAYGSHSHRNHDLGMMAHRFFITARNPETIQSLNSRA